jgi:predicted DNA-binding helix-hairpin-helix protein
VRSLDSRLEALGAGARHEHDGARPASDRWAGQGVYRCAAGGRRVSLLKVLQSTHCSGSCHYCAFRSSSDVRREALLPDELARHFLELQRRGVVQGLFLSSGIHGPPDRAMARMVDTAELVRRAGFRGYVHLKVLPGASDAAVERVVALADRVSINLEAPTQAALDRISPAKRLEGQLLAPLAAAARIAARRGLRSGVTTQFVVGGGGESDSELLGRSASLYGDRLVSRCYFSPFSPPADGPLAGVAASPRQRMVRLYQADWLLRFFGFAVDEIPVDHAGALDLGVDPKTRWAALHPERFPLEVNRASRPELLRVPGIGPTGADRIISARRQGRLRSPRALAALGVRGSLASPYLTFDGRRSGRGIQIALPGVETADNEPPAARA